MDSNASTQQIIDLLTGLTSRLDRMERVMGKVLMEVMGQSPSPQPQPPTSLSESAQVRLLTLEKLTLKRHAVLSAILGGLSYEQIAKHMDCDVSTVKLNLKASLHILGIPSRSHLLANHRDMLDFLDDAQYKSSFGLGKRWWSDQDPAVIATLQVKRRFANQHSTPKSKTP